jgi:hypothetical protein
MDEREAARNGGLPARKLRGTGFEMAGTGLRDERDDSPLVAAVQTATHGGQPVRTFRLRVASESANQHAVSIAIEAVACLHGVIVGGQDLFAARECTNQREQS